MDDNHKILNRTDLLNTNKELGPANVGELDTTTIDAETMVGTTLQHELLLSYCAPVERAPGHDEEKAFL